MKLLVALSVLSAFCSAALTPLEGEISNENLSSATNSENSSENFNSKLPADNDENVVKLLNNLLGGLGAASQIIESPDAPSEALKKSLLTEFKEVHKNYNLDSAKISDWENIFKDALGDKENYGKYLNSDSISEMLP